MTARIKIMFIFMMLLIGVTGCQKEDDLDILTPETITQTEKDQIEAEFQEMRKQVHEQLNGLKLVDPEPTFAKCFDCQPKIQVGGPPLGNFTNPYYYTPDGGNNPDLWKIPTVSKNFGGHSAFTSGSSPAPYYRLESSVNNFGNKATIQFCNTPLSALLANPQVDGIQYRFEVLRNDNGQWIPIKNIAAHRANNGDQSTQCDSFDIIGNIHRGKWYFITLYGYVFGPGEDLGWRTSHSVMYIEEFDPFGDNNFSIDEVILRNETSITSPNGQYRLALEDGMMFLYDAQGRYRWFSTGPNDAQELILREDGNLLIRDVDENIFWQTNTGVNDPGSRWKFADDGNLVVRGPNNELLWSIYSHGQAFGSQVVLHKGEVFTATNGNQLMLRDDGVLALTDASNQIIWHNSGPNTGEVLILSVDGNLILVDNKGKTIWSTNTNKRGSHWQFDTLNGNLLIWGPDNSLQWSIYTRND